VRPVGWQNADVRIPWRTDGQREHQHSPELGSRAPNQNQPVIGVPFGRILDFLSGFSNDRINPSRGGSRVECMTALMAIGLPADAIRYLTEFPGRTMCVVEVG
jgi:hypothetical protein